MDTELDAYWKRRMALLPIPENEFGRKYSDLIAAVRDLDPALYWDIYDTKFYLEDTGYACEKILKYKQELSKHYCNTFSDSGEKMQAGKFYCNNSLLAKLVGHLGVGLGDEDLEHDDVDSFAPSSNSFHMSRSLELLDIVIGFSYLGQQVGVIEAEKFWSDYCSDLYCASWMGAPGPVGVAEAISKYLKIAEESPTILTGAWHL